MTDIASEPRIGSQARVEIGSDGTKVFDADGVQIMFLRAPDDFQLTEPALCEFADGAYIRGYVEGYNHRQIGLAPKYREGDTVR